MTSNYVHQLEIRGVSALIGEVIPMDTWAARMQVPDRKGTGALSGARIQEVLGVHGKSWEPALFGRPETITGVEMFVRQAYPEFFLFTRQEAPADLMREVLKRAIGPVKYFPPPRPPSEEDIDLPTEELKDDDAPTNEEGRRGKPNPTDETDDE